MASQLTKKILTKKILTIAHFYYFDYKININDLDLVNILLDEKSCKFFLICDVS